MESMPESRVDHILYRKDVEEQIPVALLPVLRREKSLLGFDQTLVFKQGDILADRVPAHADSGTDGVVGRVARVRLPILAADQERVHENLTAGQTEVEDLVRQDELTTQTFLCFVQSDTSVLIPASCEKPGVIFSVYLSSEKRGTVELPSRTRVCEVFSRNFRGTERGTGCEAHERNQTDGVCAVAHPVARLPRHFSERGTAKTK